MNLSLETYKPSGLISSPLRTCRSAVTIPGHRGGMTPRDFESHSVDSSHFESEVWSRRYHKSPTGSNFSIPRSPMATRHPHPEPGESHPDIVEEAEEERKDCAPDAQALDDNVLTENTSQRTSGASGGYPSAVATARSSYATYRSSMASSVTSRFPSMDFQPLGCPRLQDRFGTEYEQTSATDEVSGSTGRALSLRKLQARYSPPTDAVLLTRRQARDRPGPTAWKTSTIAIGQGACSPRHRVSTTSSRSTSR